MNELQELLQDLQIYINLRTEPHCPQEDHTLETIANKFKELDEKLGKVG